jgi:hypothetical protein
MSGDSRGGALGRWFSLGGGLVVGDDFAEGEREVAIKMVA